MLRATPAYGDFKRYIVFYKDHVFYSISDRYMLRLVDPIYTKLGFNPKPTDTHLQIQLRTIAVTLIYKHLCYFHPQFCRLIGPAAWATKIACKIQKGALLLG